MQPRALLLVLSLTACVTQGQQNAQNQDNYERAPAAVGIAAAGAVISRVGGGCYAMCAFGTRCNPDNGACEPTSPEDAPQATSLTVPLAPPSPGPFNPSAVGPTPTSTPMPALQPTALGRVEDTCGGVCTAEQFCNIRPGGRGECLTRAPAIQPP